MKNEIVNVLNVAPWRFAGRGVIRIRQFLPSTPQEQREADWLHEFCAHLTSARYHTAKDAMEYDIDKIDEMILALLWLTLHEDDVRGRGTIGM